MARELSEITVTQDSASAVTVQINTRFPTDNFTLAVTGVATHVIVNAQALQPVNSRRDLAQQTFYCEPHRTVFAFALAEGETTVVVNF
jgi:hypothetical protein